MQVETYDITPKGKSYIKGKWALVKTNNPEDIESYHDWYTDPEIKILVGLSEKYSPYDKEEDMDHWLEFLGEVHEWRHFSEKNKGIGDESDQLRAHTGAIVSLAQKGYIKKSNKSYRDIKPGDITYLV